MPKIRRELNFLNDILYSLSSGQSHPNTWVFMNTQDYSPSASAYLEVVYKNIHATDDGVIRLIKSSTPDRSGNIVVDLTAVANTTSWTRLRSSITIDPNYAYYYMKTNATTNNNDVQVKSARIILIQDGDLKISVSDFEIGSRETLNTTSPGTAMSNPKYWKYEASKWGGVDGFSAIFNIHVSLKQESAAKDHHFSLQEDNGSFGGWTTICNVVSAGEIVDSDPILFLSEAYGNQYFKPTDGRHYRLFDIAEDATGDLDIYNTKMHIVQVAGPWNVPDSSIQTLLYGGSGTKEQIATSFEAPSATTIDKISLALSDWGSPTDQVYIEIATGSPGGATITNGQSQNVQLPVAGWTDFTFTTSPEISGSTKYYVRLIRTGARDTNNAPTWYKTWRNLHSGYGAYVKDNGSWGSEFPYDHSMRVFELNGKITRTQGEFLLINYPETTTGLKDYLTYFDPDEWDGVDNDYYHEHSASGGSSNTKLQEDPGGTPSDITNSSITGANLQRGSAMTMPSTAEEIDCNIVTP